jgi:starvation-inducible DNA-binding protein
METTIGIKPEQTASVALTLAGILADEYVLYTKTKKAHWNVEGLDFHAKHLLFEAQFTQLDEVIDDVAERIRTIGHYVSGSLKEFLSLTSLSEKSNSSNDSKGNIKDLLGDHQSIIIKIREAISSGDGKALDLGTSDFLTGVMASHEKMAWMLSASLK